MADRKIPSDIATALAQFPESEFCIRDIGRRFSHVRPEHVQHALAALIGKGQVLRRLRYGVFYYRASP